MKCENVKIGKISMLKVDNGNGLIVYFSAMGASIYSITFKGKCMTLTPTTMQGFLNPNAYYGKTIGPICGRIKDGIIDIDGQNYQLEQNEGNNTLHSGLGGISNTIFSTKVVNSNDILGVFFSHKRKPEKKGIPGVINYYISYSITKDNKIYLSQRVVLEKAMVLSLTNHLYFCLGEKSIHSLKLKVPASKVVEVNSQDMIPERYIDIPSCLDFRKISPITKDINNPYLVNSKTLGIDHYFHLDNPQDLIVLEGNHFKLEIKSNYQGAQIYTDNYADNIEMRDISCLDHRGVAIEPQDSPLERKTYHKGEIYDKWIEYSFIEK